MKERPILMNGAMVRAVLNGGKTQTRRIVKGTALEWLEEAGFTPEFVAYPANHLCPFGVQGDQLWVRETWGFNPDFPGLHAHACYRADPGHEYDGIKWKPSIHMPRAACRIKLEVTKVRVERLQDISYEDAIAEGMFNPDKAPPFPFESEETPEQYGRRRAYPQRAYRELWEDINGAGSWDANPWVWVVEFEVSERRI